MDSISNSSSSQMVGTGKPSLAQMKQKAKENGASEEIIAQGEDAIKKWARENGKIPSSAENRKDLTNQLEAAGISRDKFDKAIEEGHESVQALFEEHDFSLDLEA